MLGDRIRMMEHCGDEQVFIRSLANRGRLGGLTCGIRGSVRVMGLAGCDVVLLETVGVGQNEIDVAQVADLVVVVLAPGLGDSVQLLKSGLLEIADVVAVNKADRPGADRLFAELQAMLAGGANEPPPALLVDSLQRRGVEELVETIERRAAERAAAKRRPSLEQEIIDAVRESARVLIDQAIAEGLPGEDAIDRVKSGQATVEQLAAELLESAAAQSTGQGSLSTVA